MAKGSWIWDGNKEECICSECGKGNLKYSTAFCPDCGADMREEHREAQSEIVNKIVTKLYPVVQNTFKAVMQEIRTMPVDVLKANTELLQARNLLREATKIIQRLGTQTQDCTSCARLPLCNAYEKEGRFENCDYKWRCADEVEQYEKS